MYTDKGTRTRGQVPCPAEKVKKSYQICIGKVLKLM